MGNAVFVIDALDGTLLKTFHALDGVSPSANIGRSVAADVAIVDTDYDGRVDRAYAVDLGGRVYRIDFESAAGHAPADWTIHPVADLSGGTTTGRKFFYAPDVVVTKNFAALLVGSGDREKPLRADTQDHFFQIFDRRLAKGAPAVATPVVWTDLVAAADTPSVDGAGCYLALATGEKVVNAATSIGGQTFFGTNRPAPSSGNSCSANLGIAKSYAMPLFCTRAAGSVLAGGGLPPSPVAGIALVEAADGTTRQVPFVIGAPNARNSAIEGSRVNPVIDAPRRRRFWYQEVER
jgi:type IV pilus assembly protein PilY1